jgi:small subunit ribosomal protein S20
VKSAVKKVRETLEGGELAAAQDAFKTAARVIDQASSKGVVHRNTASRKISRLAKAVAKSAKAK